MPGKILLYTTIFFHLSMVVLFCSTPVKAIESEKMTIGLIPEMDVFKQIKRFRPLAAYLSKNLDKKVELSVLSRYGNIIERLQDKKLDAAFLGSFTGALAISQLQLEPLARPVNADGTSSYFGHIFTRNDSGIKDIADMKGRTFVFVERATTAGYVYPLAYLKKNKITDLDSFFKSYYFAGSHDAAIAAVLEGRADIGAAKNTIYDRMRKSHPEIDRDLTILANSPTVPSNGLCVIKDMPTKQKNRLQDLLLRLHTDPKGKIVLDELGALRFVKTSEEDYQPVFNLAEEAGLKINQYQYNNQ